MVDLVTNPVELVRRFNAFAYSEGVPDAARERLQTIPGVAADIIVEGTEVLYAHFDLLNDQGKEVLAQMAAYGVSQNWTSLNADGRWEKIRDRARHDLGEEVELIDNAEMPPPQVTRRGDEVDWRDPPPPPEA